MTRTLRIAIVGGGIGGLTLAVALRQRGIEADVYEQAPELAEIGAAVALSANSNRELRRLGILEALAAVSTEPSELIYRNWRDAGRVAAHPVHENMNYQQTLRCALLRDSSCRSAAHPERRAGRHRATS